jgi:hypothetical protein
LSIALPHKAAAPANAVRIIATKMKKEKKNIAENF